MSLEDTKKIDFIAQSPHFDGFDLLAIDSLEQWDQLERYNAMLEKLTSYVKYIESEEVFESDLVVKGKEFNFWVICQTPPNEAMLSITALRTKSEPVQRFSVFFANSAEEYLNGT